VPGQKLLLGRDTVPAYIDCEPCHGPSVLLQLVFNPETSHIRNKISLLVNKVACPLCPVIAFNLLSSVLWEVCSCWSRRKWERCYIHICCSI